MSTTEENLIAIAEHPRDLDEELEDGMIPVEAVDLMTQIMVANYDHTNNILSMIHENTEAELRATRSILAWAEAMHVGVWGGTTREYEASVGRFMRARHPDRRVVDFYRAQIRSEHGEELDDHDRALLAEGDPVLDWYGYGGRAE